MVKITSDSMIMKQISMGYCPCSPSFALIASESLHSSCSSAYRAKRSSLCEYRNTMVRKFRSDKKYRSSLASDCKTILKVSYFKNPQIGE